MKHVDRFEDPADELNSDKHHTGKPCNAARMKKIGQALQHVVDRLDGKVPEDSEPPKGWIVPAQVRAVRHEQARQEAGHPDR